MVYVLMDCLQMVGQGLINGIGKQATASLFTLTGFWFLGVPTAYVLFVVLNMGMSGLWTGPILALTFCFIGYYGLLLKVDWRE